MANVTYTSVYQIETAQAASGLSKLDRGLDAASSGGRELDKVLEALLGETKRTADGIEKLGKRTRKTGDDADSMAASFKRTVGALLTFAVAVEGLRRLARFTAESVTLAQEQAQAYEQVRQGVESTGMAAGITAKQIAEIATALQDATGVGDEVILRLQSKLLTFTNIGKEIFGETTERVLDLAERMEGDLNGALLQVGKALNDPVKNLSALSRAGIQFTEQQTDMIKGLIESGHLLDAQKIILAELAVQFGGSARAAAELDFRGQAAAIGDVKEQLGRMVDGPLRDLAPLITESAVALRDWLSAINDNIDAVGGLATAWALFVGNWADQWITMIQLADDGRQAILRIENGIRSLVGLPQIEFELSLDPLLSKLDALRARMGEVAGHAFFKRLGLGARDAAGEVDKTTTSVNALAVAQEEAAAALRNMIAAQQDLVGAGDAALRRMAGGGPQAVPLLPTERQISDAGQMIRRIFGEHVIEAIPAEFAAQFADMGEEAATTFGEQLGNVIGGLSGAVASLFGAGAGRLAGGLGGLLGSGGALSELRDARADLNEIEAAGAERAGELGDATERVSAASIGAAQGIGAIASAVTGLLRSTGIAEGRGSTGPLGGYAGGDYSTEGGAAGAAIGAIAGGIAGSIFGFGVGHAAGALIGSAIGEAIGTLVGSFINEGSDELFAQIQQGADGSLQVISDAIHGSSGFAAVGEEFGQLLEDGLTGIIDSIGGHLEAIQGLNVNIRAGEYVDVFFDGLSRRFEATTEGFEQALEFALVESLKRAEVSGLSPTVRAALDGFSGSTFEELDAALTSAFQLDRLSVPDIVRPVIAKLDETWALIQKAMADFGGAGVAEGLTGPGGFVDSMSAAVDALFGRTPDIDAATRAHFNALKAELEIRRISVLALLAEAEAKGAATLSTVQYGQALAEGANLATRSAATQIEAAAAAAGGSAALSEVYIAGSATYAAAAAAAADALASIDELLAQFNAPGALQDAQRAARQAQSSANAAARESEARAREAAQREVELAVARAEGGQAAADALMAEWARADAIEHIRDVLGDVAAATYEAALAEAELADERQQVVDATRQGIDAARTFSDILREAALGEFGADLADFGDQAAAAVQQIQDALAAGGDPAALMDAFDDVQAGLAAGVAGMIADAFAAAAGDPEALAALRDSLEALLANLPAGLEGVRDLIEEALAGLGMDITRAVVSQIREGRREIDSASSGLLGNLISVIDRYGGAASITDEQRIAAARLEFEVTRARIVLERQALAQLIADYQAIGLATAGLEEQLGLIDGLLDTLLGLEPDFSSLAASTSDAAEAAARAAEAATTGADLWAQQLRSAQSIIDFLASQSSLGDPFGDIRLQFDNFRNMLSDPGITSALAYLGLTAEEAAAQLDLFEAARIAEEIDRILSGVDDLIRQTTTGASSGLSPGQQLAAAQAEYRSLVARAAAGDSEAARLVGVRGQELLRMSEGSPQARVVEDLVREGAQFVRALFPDAVLGGDGAEILPENLISERAIITARDLIEMPLSGRDLYGLFGSGFGLPSSALSAGLSLDTSRVEGLMRQQWAEAMRRSDDYRRERAARDRVTFEREDRRLRALGRVGDPAAAAALSATAPESTRGSTVAWR